MEKHYYCEEMITGERFLVNAFNYIDACAIAEEVGADFSCGCEREPDVWVDPIPLTEAEAEATGLDEY